MRLSGLPIIGPFAGKVLGEGFFTGIRSSDERELGLGSAEGSDVPATVHRGRHAGPADASEQEMVRRFSELAAQIAVYRGMMRLVRAGKETASGSRKSNPEFRPSRRHAERIWPDL